MAYVFLLIDISSYSQLKESYMKYFVKNKFFSCKLQPYIVQIRHGIFDKIYFSAEITRVNNTILYKIIYCSIIYMY